MNVKVPRLKGSSDRQRSALDEAQQVAGWARATDGEWVRSLGAIWEAFAEDAQAERLKHDYVAALEAMLAHHGLDALEVVVRQLRERHYVGAGDLAAQRGVAAFPDESWAHSVAANCARQVGDPKRGLLHDRRMAELLEVASPKEAVGGWRRCANAAGLAGDPATLELALGRLSAHGSAGDGHRQVACHTWLKCAGVAGRAGDGASRDLALDRAAALAATDDERRMLKLLDIQRKVATDPHAALAEALVLHAEVARDPSLIAETDAGHGVVELLLELLLPNRDARAIAVAQSLLDAKLALWGEAPATWVERYNLGTVYCQLGQTERGRTLIREAREVLADQLGESDPNVAMCDRTLAKI